MSGIKCIIRIDQATRSPQGNSSSSEYVTNEDGTPRVFKSLTEAREYIAVYYGKKTDRNDEMHNVEWVRPGTDKYTNAYIIRDSSKEYAEIVKQIETAAALAAFEDSRPTVEDIRAKYDSPYLIWEDDPETMTPQNYAAEAAAFSFIEAYAGASLFRPSETDPEFIAAFHVAADDVAGMHIATDADRSTVADMLEEIAEDTAWSAAYAILRKDPDVTPEEMREIMDNPRAYLMSAARAAIAEARAVNPAPLYQRYELLAYLGEPEDYDVDAIEAEATRFTADGAQVWTAFGEDLAAIAERHQLVTYWPAI